MNTDLSLFHLIKEASFVVQFVMLLLLTASVASWTFIFSKRKELNRAIEITDEFEEQFWSGVALADLYRKLAAKDFEPEGIEKIFLAGYKDFSRMRQSGNVEPAAAFNVGHTRRPIALMGDGGFWHNGLTSGIANAVFNKHDGVTVIVDNGYSAATGGQNIPSSRGDLKNRDGKHPIETAVRGVGIEWVRAVRTYDMPGTMAALREALTTSFAGPKIIIAEGECQLTRQRRIAPLMKKEAQEGRRVVRQRFGVDEDLCTGDHSCIRLSGCPSLTVKARDDGLRRDAIAYVDNSCVGCGVCGDVAHAATLCPSFYRADVIINPTGWDRFVSRLRAAIIGWSQRRGARRRLALAIE